MKKKIYLGSDHAGWRLKERVKQLLAREGYTIEDCSPLFIRGDDYPPLAFAVAVKVRRSRGRGILICDTGAGVAIAANRVKGVRAIPCYSVGMARHARTDNNANVLCLGAEISPFALAKKIIAAWLATPFSRAPRHHRRVEQLDRL